MDRLIIGVVLKPQGIRGEIKIKSYTDSPADIKNFKTVYIGDISYKVLSCRVDSGVVYLALRGIADRDAAEALRGKNIEADREDAPELEEGTYYIVDIIGCEVFDEKGEKLGVIKDIAASATDVYTINNGKKDILFPAVKGVVASVDIANKKLIVNKKRFYEVAVL